MLNNDLINNYPDLVPEKAPIIIFNSESAVCMDNNGKNTKHTRHISIRMNSVRNGKECNMKKKV